MTGEISSRDVTIVVPTRGRKARVEQLLGFITHRPLLLVIDAGAVLTDLPGSLDGASVLEVPAACGSPKALDAGIRACQTSHCIFINDDIDWGKAAAGFVESAIRTFNECKFPDNYGVVALEDGNHNGTMACFALVSKQFWVDNIDPSEYGRYGMDIELTEKAIHMKRYGYCKEAVLPHLHDNGMDLRQDAKDLIVMRNRMEAYYNLHTDRNPKKVFIGLPIYGNVDMHFFCSALQLMAEFCGQAKIRPLFGDSLVPRARNNLSHEFLKSDCTHLLFIDSDLVFSMEQITRIISHGEDVVGGFYAKKQEGDVELVCNSLPNPVSMDERRLTPVNYIGTGFLCVSRRVFEKMIEVYGDEIGYICDGDKEKKYDFWRVGVFRYKDGQPSRYLSEDWYFCQMARDLGFTVYGDNGIMLKHSGNALYPLKHQEQNLFRAATVASDTVAAVAPSPVQAAT